MTDRRQYNVRLSPDSADRLARLMSLAADRAGVPVQQTRVIEAALLALEREWTGKKVARRVVEKLP